MRGSILGIHCRALVSHSVRWAITHAVTCGSARATSSWLARMVGLLLGHGDRGAGSGTLNKRGQARVNSVSCATTGNCAAVGDYHDGPA